MVIAFFALLSIFNSQRSRCFVSLLEQLSRGQLGNHLNNVRR